MLEIPHCGHGKLDWFFVRCVPVGHAGAPVKDEILFMF
jgi:hypothetical protein